MRLYLVAALSLALIGCASSGPKIDAARLSEVRKGETTIADVVGRFGRPSVLSKNMDGTQTAAYMHAEGRSDPAAFIPLMGALAGNADANVDSVIFYFDSKGILSDYKTTQANANTTAQGNANKATQTDTSKATQTSTNTAAQPDKNKAAQTSANKATQTDNKAPSGDSNTWTIRGWQPSGYKENR